jgi:hypothetical protein
MLTEKDLPSSEISDAPPPDEGDAAAPPPSNDAPPDPVEPPQPELQPDPEPEYSEPEECDAAALLDINYSETETTTSPSDETTCKYTITLTNIGNENIKVFLFRHQRFYTGDEEQKWEGKWSLAVGESMDVECEKETRNWVEDEKTKTSFNFIEKIAPIFDRPGCLNTFDNNSTAKEKIAVPVNVFCD